MRTEGYRRSSAAPARTLLLLLCLALLCAPTRLEAEEVDDDATQALMLEFYERWRGADGKGLDAATALREAQAFVRSHEKWKHPCFWSAWVLWGSSE